MCSPSLEDVPDVLSSESFSELPILAVTREWQASGSMLRWFADNNIHYRNVTICNTFRTTASLAMDGLGLAQLPVDVFRKEVGQGQLRVLRSHPELPPLHIFAIRPAGQVSALYSVIENASRVAAAGAAEVLPPL
jgi:DNA-binding transcriptional LysR family regulator